MAYALGIDVSHHQGDMNWDKAKAAGAKFAFIRAGSITALDGSLYDDWQFDRNSAIAPKVLPIGYYWFFRPEWNSIKQAEYFCNLVEGKGNRLPLVLDVERNDKGVSVDTYRLRVRLALEYIESRTGKTPLVYTRASVWNPWLGSTTWMQKYGLWVAHYTTIYPQPILPWAWPNWTFWQWSADGNGLGATYGAQSGSIDINRFNGDESAFLGYAGEENKYMKVDLLDDSIRFLPDDTWNLGKVFVGANGGVAYQISNLPAGAKGLLVRVISTSDKVDGYVFLGSGNSGMKRFKVGTRQKVASPSLLAPYEEANGLVKLDSNNQLWVQWDSKGGLVKVWVEIQGYLMV